MRVADILLLLSIAEITQCRMTERSVNSEMKKDLEGKLLGII
jgi:hypothetical protein